MGCWNQSWFEAALSRQEGRRRVLKTQRNRVHLSNISVRGAVPRAGAGCSRAAAGDSRSIDGNGNTAWGERRHRDINLPEAGVGRGEPLYPSANHGHRWDCVWEQECSSPRWGCSSKAHAVGHRGRQAPARGTFRFPELGGYSAASSPALGSLCSLPECSQGKETADECEERTGQS